jgi:hypothetical protein
MTERSTREAFRRPVRRPDRATWDDELASPERWVEPEEASFKATGNPIYVWRAIVLQNIYRLNTAIGVPGWRPGDPLPPLLLPAWCARYLAQVALAIDHLAWGLDDTTKPSTGDRDWRTNPTLNARSALSRIAASLQFARHGWNAFDEFWRSERKIEIDDARSRFRSDGLSRQEADNKVLEVYGLADERNIRRHYAHARRHRGRRKSDAAKDP